MTVADMKAFQTDTLDIYARDNLASILHSIERGLDKVLPAVSVNTQDQQDTKQMALQAIKLLRNWDYKFEYH